ncbi:MAG: FecR family protein [Cytophagia bacterium]|nr:MAG: FecR family protein [Cytophagales bacterium]TAG37755.1 MAG: FecR family protein [Cytophagia bacterium]TAG58363.1 MAG: FecR family protein [Runella slithyformis]TAG74166.1 MAG: FecR family protein [Runella slithyformis]TAG78938.1 MAG: FecR family protein [Cytophagales bacterium]
MRDYEHDSIAELITDDYFLESCLNPSPASDLFWQDWLQTRPHCRENWEEARYIIKTLSEGSRHYALVRLSAEKVEMLWQRIQATAFTNKSGTPQKPFFRFGGRRRVAAAALLLILGAFCGWLVQQKEEFIFTENIVEKLQEIKDASLQKTTNQSAQSQAIRLPDGSIITLSPGGSLRYSLPLDTDKRVVYLDGEAIFEVKSDVSRPFLVYANDLVTKVLGTRFKITTTSKLTKVSVISGKVSVVKRINFGKPEVQALILLPNQQLIYDSDKKDLLKTLVENPLIMHQPVQKHAFEFEETPVGEVFEILKNAYDINIVYEESALEKCTLTASLTSQSLYIKLDLVCEALQLEYTIVDGQVVIGGKGCP